MKISLDDCRGIIREALEKVAANAVITEFNEGAIQVINGRFGPYIKSDGNNYKIPKGVDAASLTLEKCQEIIDSAGKDKKRPARFKKVSK
jgi:DNA topoisomerase-1